MYFWLPLVKPSVVFTFYHYFSVLRRRPLPPTQFVRGKTVNRGSNPKPKKAKTKVSFERDIVCLPLNYPEEPGVFPFPRGKVRSSLGRQGLIGKIHLDSEMSEREIFQEIRSVFKVPFREDEQFPFKILQSAGMGAKSLVIPALSTTYEWKAKEVANSGGRVVYIWAQRELYTTEPEQVRLL